jgi:hypothetical protein
MSCQLAPVMIPSATPCSMAADSSTGAPAPPPGTGMAPMVPPRALVPLKRRLLVYLDAVGSPLGSPRVPVQVWRSRQCPANP